jgi:urease accessory protein
MDLIHAPLTLHDQGVLEVFLSVDRLTLAKRRWRGTAEDGREFGFDLAEPLNDAAPFFYHDGTSYLIAQQPEPVIEIHLSSPSDSARLGWLIGNLHFSLEIRGDIIHVATDSALRQMLIRENIPFIELSRVFHPFGHGHVH